MLLKRIELINFRNFNKSVFDFSPLLNIIIGSNAKGKTNLLEAIYFVINGVGFRESKETELINFKAKDYSSVEGVFITDDIRITFKIIFNQKEEKVQKVFLVDNTKKRFFQYLKEKSRAVLFTPQQIEILTGSPERRRDYLNKIISIFDFEYKKNLDNFEQGLRRRNKILERHLEQMQLKEEIAFWDDYLIKHASYITKKRAAYIDFLNSNSNIDKKIFKIVYLKNEFSSEKVKDVFAKETLMRRTLIGPQKDDMQIFMNDKNIHHFGSRSEQRLTILWLKLNEIKNVERMTNRKPILLFDDVFSELDPKNKKLVLHLFKNYQTIASTTEVEVLELADVPKSLIGLT